MAIVLLADLQRRWRVEQRRKHRRELRCYLISRRDPSSAAFNTVARRLYADGLIDNLGLTDHWLASASETERAMLFSEIATASLKV